MILNFIKTRRAGFWVMVGAMVVALIEAIVYGSTYLDPLSGLSGYFSAAALALPFAGIVVALAASVFRPTREWAPVVLFAFEFASFGTFITGTYMYLSEVFYAGITAEAFAALNKGFTASVALYLIAFIASITAIFLKQGAEQKSANKNRKEEAQA